MEKSQKADFSFAGFKRNSGYTNTPDISFDLFPSLLTGAEIKVLDYIYRRSTLDDFDVSINQMLRGLVTKSGKRLDFGCGVKSKQTILNALKKLQHLGLVLVQKRIGYDGRNLSNIYTLQYSAEGFQDSTLLESYLASDKSPTKEGFEFEGFRLPRFTPVPDDIYDIMPHVLSHRAYLVVRYICRHTFGYKKRTDSISLTQMLGGIVSKEGKRIDFGCGLKKKQSIIDGIREAVELGIVVKTLNKSAKGNNLTSDYGLKFKDKESSELTHIPTKHAGVIGASTPSLKRELPLVQKGNYPSPKRELPLVQKGNSQDTDKQNTEEQDTDKQQQRRSRQEQSKEITQGEDVVAFLKKQGFSVAVSKKLAESVSIGYAKEKVEYLDFVQEKNSIPNPLGWLRKAIEDDYGMPSGFKTREERAQETQEAQKNKVEAERVRQNFEESQRVQKAEKQQAQDELISMYRDRHGTVEQDKKSWEEVKETLCYSPQYKIVISAMEGLRIDKETGEVLIGVLGTFIFNKVSHPKFKSGLVRDISHSLNISEAKIDFVLMEDS